MRFAGTKRARVAVEDDVAYSSVMDRKLEAGAPQ